MAHVGVGPRVAGPASWPLRRTFLHLVEHLTGSTSVGEADARESRKSAPAGGRRTTARQCDEPENHGRTARGNPTRSNCQTRSIPGCALRTALVSSQRQAAQLARSDPRCTGGREPEPRCCHNSRSVPGLAWHPSRLAASLLHVARQPVSASRPNASSAPHSVYRKACAHGCAIIRTREALCAASDEVVAMDTTRPVRRSIVVAVQARRERGQFLRRAPCEDLTAGRSGPAAVRCSAALNGTAGCTGTVTDRAVLKYVSRYTTTCRRRCRPRRWKSRLSTMASRPNPYRNGRKSTARRRFRVNEAGKPTGVPSECNAP